ncbi:lactonase family protein [Caldimonas taiwanensis]|uniref:lactonase family protein n=1 Tax=Caldimonas taiwanensis TaxID=307483 RepID=UPI0018DC2240|nr:beta-propeller fold lactonase family protein [Caldimonas taiwanensis]
MVSCADSGELHSLALSSEGRLTPRQRLSLGGSLMPMAVHPAQHRLYIARRSDPLAVISLAIDRDGTLTPLAETSMPASMAYLACDRDGRYLLAASYGADCISIGPIDHEGVARAVEQILPTGRHAHAVVPDPANRYVYATSLGSNLIHRYRLQQGRLLETEPATIGVRAGSGPRHLVFHPGGRWLYLLNELDAGLDTFDVEPETGLLYWRHRVSVLPPGFSGQPWAAELRLSAGAHRLLATERRSSTLSVFDVATEPGQPRLLAQIPTEAQPRGMQVTPDAKLAVVAGQASHHITAYLLDMRTGALVASDRARVGLNPNWVEILDLSP